MSQFNHFYSTSTYGSQVQKCWSSTQIYVPPNLSRISFERFRKTIFVWSKCRKIVAFPSKEFIVHLGTCIKSLRIFSAQKYLIKFFEVLNDAFSNVLASHKNFENFLARIFFDPYHLNLGRCWMDEVFGTWQSPPCSSCLC